MANLPIDSDVASTYRKMDAAWAKKTNTKPMLQGLDDDEVLGVAKKLDPNFSSNYHSAYNQAPGMAKVVQSVGDVAGKVVDTATSALNSVKVPVVNELANLGKAANDKLQPALEEADPFFRDSGMSRPLPETQAGVLGTTLLAALGRTPSLEAGAENISVPAKSIASISPDTGMLVKTLVPDAESLAKSDFISNPETHGALAQSHLQALSDAAKSHVDLQYNKLSDLVGENGALAQVPIDVSDVSRIANEADASLMQHPDFQTAAMKKMKSIMAVDTNQGSSAEGPITAKGGVWGSSKLETPADLADWHEMEPSGSQMSAQDVVGLRKSLNKIYGSQYKTPTGNLAGKMIDSLDAAFSKDAPDILKDANEKAMSVAKDYYNTYRNKDVEGFLNAQSDKAHSYAMGGVDRLKAIRNAGGETAIEHLRRSAAYDLYNDIDTHNWSGDKVNSLLRTNRPLDHLLSNGDYSDMTGDRFAKIADDRLKAIEANKAIDEEAGKPTVKQKIVDAAKKAGITATGAVAGGAVGSLGGPVGTVAGAVTGAGIATGLSDFLGK